MSRPRTPARFADLVDAATRVFIAAGGFRRAQVADVAHALGVAKGTVYLYAESKEALFDLALRHADGPPAVEPAVLPVPTPPVGALEMLLAERLEARGQFPTLAAALAGAPPPSRKATEPHPTGARRADRRPLPDPAAAEVDAVLGEVFDTFYANRTALRLVNAAARDLPGLGALWFDQARGPLHAGLTAWVAARVESGAFAPVPDPSTAARVCLESCTWFAVHRHFDPRPDGQPDATVRATVLTMLRRTLLARP